MPIRVEKPLETTLNSKVYEGIRKWWDLRERYTTQLPGLLSDSLFLHARQC
jgi:hypothetical protein